MLQSPGDQAALGVGTGPYAGRGMEVTNLYCAALVVWVGVFC